MDDSATEPRKLWNDYFSKRTPKPATVRQLVRKLHGAQRHEHVIAVIESAIINGQSQPWMYEVLALSMEIVGRPKAEIERVLLSQIDFTAADIPSMIYSGAYLTRFDAHRQALNLYQQASRIESTRPEPYVLGLKLARRLKDPDAVEWAAAGILTYAWTRDFEDLHRVAEDAALEIEQLLIDQGMKRRAAQLTETLAQARQRDLVLELQWSGDGDLDMAVEEPLGTVCSTQQPRTTGGGIFVHDGYGPKQDNCHDDYVCPLALPGDYTVRVQHMGGNIVGKRATLKIIRYQGTPKQMERTVSFELKEGKRSVTLSLHEGRRNELSQAPRAELAIGGTSQRNRTKHRTLPQMVGPIQGGAQAALANFQESRESPFVTGVRPNANGVGYTPIISVLTEGVTMAAMAVVSADRRYVRLSVSPNFTSITDIVTFSFQGTPQTSGVTTGGGNNGGQGGGGGGGGTP